MKTFIATFLAILAAVAVLGMLGVAGTFWNEVRQRKLENSLEYQQVRTQQRQFVSTMEAIKEYRIQLGSDLSPDEQRQLNAARAALNK
jgi:hypothetical protein